MTKHWTIPLVVSVLGGLGLGVYGSTAAVPASIPEVIDLCAPIIAEEYQGDRDRWFECVQGTQDFVNLILGPPTLTNDTAQTAADLVLELSKLYQDGDICEQYETELPDAIEVALKFEMDEQQKELIQSISDSIAACQTLETGAIPEGVPVSRN
ncbi:MAG TPA: hypothetical protein VG757_01660 [Devosia sp.]|nr:hypothetical protein [Devosia sp.]